MTNETEEPKHAEKTRTRRSGSNEAARETALSFVRGLVQRIGLDVMVEVTNDDNGLHVDLDGPDDKKIRTGLGLNRGDLPNAIQTLTSVAVSGRGRSNATVSIDVGHWQQQREESMNDMAGLLGDKVHQLGKSITLLGVSSYDRRTIHRALENDDRVKTNSEGFGAFRRLKVIQKRKNG